MRFHGIRDEDGGLTNYSSFIGTQDVLYDFTNRDTFVFSIIGNNTDNDKLEIATDCTFYTHKLNVIRNSIQYNLNLAMSTYNYTTGFMFDYQMPVLDEGEWEKILTNVSLVSFMQGYSCGLKMYNNYKIVTSTNNELTIIPDELYYVKKRDYNNEDAIYHKIDCEDFIKNFDSSNDEYIAFTSKDVKYDKLYEKKETSYRYDHKNLACYECVNDRNYNHFDVFNPPSDNKLKKDGSIVENSTIKSLKKAYYIGVGKSRNNIYKMNAFANSQGRQTLYYKNEDNSVVSGMGNGDGSILKLDHIKEIKVTHITFFGGEEVIPYKVIIGGYTYHNGMFGAAKGTFTIPVDATTTANTSVTYDAIRFELEKDYVVKTSTTEYRKLEATNTADLDFLNTQTHNAIISIEVIYK